MDGSLTLDADHESCVRVPPLITNFRKLYIILYLVIRGFFGCDPALLQGSA